MPRFAIVLFALLAAPSVSASRTWHVYPDGSGDAPTIAAAIDSSVAPDTIAVHPGTYFEHDLPLRVNTTVLGIGPRDAIIVDGHVDGERSPTVFHPEPLAVPASRAAARMARALDAPADPDTAAVLPEADGRDAQLFRGAGARGAGRSATARIAGRVDRERFALSPAPSREGAADGWAVAGLTILGGDAGVMTGETGTLTVSDCVFGVSCFKGVISEGGALAVSSSVFECENAGVGVIRITDESVTVTGCEFRNEVRGLWTTADYQVTDSLFENVIIAVFAGSVTGSVTSTRFEGGQMGVHASRCSTTVAACEFIAQTAYGLHLIISGYGDASDSRFEGIGALGFGAGLYSQLSGEPLDVRDCDFRGNRGPAGGAINAYGTTTLSGSRFVGNTAVRGGAICSAGPITMTSCTFLGNEAESGSFLYGPSNNAVTLDRCVVAGDGNQTFFDIPVFAPVNSVCTDLWGYGPRDERTLALLSSGDAFAADPVFCAGDDLTVVDHSFCAPAYSPCGELVGAGPVACATFGVYLDTAPPGLRVMGDGVARAGAAFYEWDIGETHQVAAVDSQFTAFGTGFVFREWDDGGAKVHDVTVSGPGVIATALYDERLALLMEWTGNGTVFPGSSLYVPGEVVQIQAVPDSGWAFFGWWGDGAGNYSGPDSVATVTMTESVLQHATFVPGTEITIHSVPDGRTVLVAGEPVTTPAHFFWPQNQGMPIDANTPQEFAPGRRYRFVSWSDGGSAQHGVPVGTSPIELTVEYALEYALTFDDEEHASLIPDDSWHAPGAQVQIEAVPDYEWAFAAWSGSGDGAYSGLDNPATVTMNEPIQQDAVIVGAFEGHGYDFTISSSSTDPFAQESPPTGGVRNLYLWGTCLQRGLSALEAQVTGTIPMLGFEAAPGVLNAGSATHLFMAVGGCPTGPESNTLLGHWIVVDDGGGTLCLGPPDGAPIAVADCTPVTPLVWPDPGVTGFSSDGSPPCRMGTNACLEDPVLVELSGLEAVAVDGAVAVSWRTALETNHDGFHVYRSEIGEGTPTRRTDGMIRGRSPYSWIDREVRPDHTYRYWIHAIDVQGRVQRFGPAEVTTPRRIAAVTRFAGPRPTPFRGRCRLAFSLAEAGRVELEIHDVTGRRVRRYVDRFPAGEQVVEWDARADDGRAVPGGVYFATFRAGDVKETRKIVLLPGR